MSKCVIVFALFATLAFAQEPQPQLPLTYIDTTFNPPTGATWYAHTSADLTYALNQSNPGDTIVLDAGVTYVGNFTLPVKANPSQQWIYIEGSALSSLPPQGTRVNPATDANSMPKIVSANSYPAVTFDYGANHYRFTGLEFSTASTVGCKPNHSPPLNCFSFQLIKADWMSGQLLSDSLTVDRCYLHGSPTLDIREAILGNASNVAVVDSYISDIHNSTFDSQALGAYASPGPFKVVNNFLSATTEEILFGGAGGVTNPWVAADIEIRNNYFYKPLSWEAVGVTIPPNNIWSEKNHLEFKSARRALVDGNVLENTWVSGQVGYAILLTVRTATSGNGAVVDDITITNNVLKNVNMGIDTLGADYNCPKTPNCTSPGEVKRVKIFNNLVLFKDPNSTGGRPNFGVTINAGLTDVLVQHNTFVPASGPLCYEAIYFELASETKWPPANSITHNTWILDNAVCHQVTGDDGGTGTVGLGYYMGDPAPLNPRFYGNVMYFQPSDKIPTLPPDNDATQTPFTYVNPSAGDYQLASPYWTDTSDGNEAGIDNSKLPPH